MEHYLSEDTKKSLKHDALKNGPRLLTLKYFEGTSYSGDLTLVSGQLSLLYKTFNFHIRSELSKNRYKFGKDIIAFQCLSKKRECL